MFCPKCGNQNEDNATFCKYCGTSFSELNQVTEEPVKSDGAGVPKGASASGAGKKGSLALKLAIVGLVVILAGVAAIVVYQFWKPEVKNGSSGSGETTASSGDTTETTTEPEVTYTEEELAKELGYTPASNSYTFSMTAYYRQPIRFEWDYYVDATDLGNTYLAAKYLDLDGGTGRMSSSS